LKNFIEIVIVIVIVIEIVIRINRTLIEKF